MNYKRLFLNWLEQNHIRTKFLYNCCTIRSAVSSIHQFPIKYIWKQDPFLYMYNSFAWVNSSEGHSFWSNYNFIWQDFLSQYIGKYVK